MDARWKDDPHVDEAGNKFTYDMNYRRKYIEFSNRLRKQSGGS